MSVKDNTYTEETARKAYRRLHVHASNGYEPGDCHCGACDIIVQDLVAFFGIQKPDIGVYSPAARVREAAEARGW